jgi:hypothetical protein
LSALGEPWAVFLRDPRRHARRKRPEVGSSENGGHGSAGGVPSATLSGIGTRGWGTEPLSRVRGFSNIHSRIFDIFVPSPNDPSGVNFYNQLIMKRIL